MVILGYQSKKRQYGGLIGLITPYALIVVPPYFHTNTLSLYDEIQYDKPQADQFFYQSMSMQHEV